VRSATEPLTDSPAGKLMQTILAGVAQFDNDVRAERSRAGMAEIAARGGWTHQPPFGMLSARKDGFPILLPDPDRAPHLVEMFRLIADGQLTPAACPRWLSTRLGHRVRPQTIAKILKQRVYTGEICNRLTKGVPVRAAFDPLVDPDTWQKVQARVSKKADHIMRSVKHNFVLQGVAICSCGRKLTASISRSHTGRRYGYYSCRCCAVRIPVGIVHQHLAEFFADEANSITPVLDIFGEIVRAEYTAMQADTIAEQAKRQAEIAKIDRHLERLLDLMISGRIAADVYDRKRRDLDIQKAVAKSAVQSLSIDELDYDAILSTASFIFSGLYETLCRIPHNIKPAFTKAVFGGLLTLHPDGKVSNPHKTGAFSDLRACLASKSTMAPPRGSMSNPIGAIIRDLAAIIQYAQAA
jgi:hypothetical protein